MSQHHVDEPLAPNPTEVRDCGVPDNVGPSFPSLTDSLAAAFGLSFLLLAIIVPCLVSLLRRTILWATQLIPLCLLVSITGTLGVALYVSSWSPFVSAAVPTQGEVASVLLLALVPVWLLVTGCILLLARWVAALLQVGVAQPN